MVNPQKLFQRLVSGSRDLRFDDFQAILRAFGFVLRRINGSHHIYTHPRLQRPFPIQPRNDGKAKSYQVDQFLKLVETHGLTFEKDE
jgi:predicted RNA binding protein YcfA (HicA-like mRNA interferase family)